MHSSNRNSTWKGFFYLPAAEAESIPGTVRIDENGEPVLELLGCWKEQGVGYQESYSVIQGKTDTAPRITLFYCSAGGKQVHFGSGIVKQRLRPGLIVEGYHFEKYEDLKLECLSFRMTHFQSWLGMSGVRVRYKKTITDGYSLTCDSLKTISLYECSRFRVLINFVYSLPFPLEGERSIEVNEVAYVRIEPTNSLPIEEVQDVRLKLQNLISFLVGEPIRSFAFSGFNNELVESSLLEGGQKPIGLSLRYNRQLANEGHVGNDFDYVTKYPDVSEDFTTIANKYFENYDTVAPVIELFTSLRKDEAAFPVEQLLLNQAQVLEAFHRRVFGGRDVDEGTHSERIGAILESCPRQHQEWLRIKLAYSNEISLRRRIIDIWQRLEHVSSDFPIKRKSFVSKICLLRNYYTHYGAQHDEEVPGFAEQARLASLLEILNEAMILDWLGLSHAVVAKLARRRLRKLPKLIDWND